MLTKLKKRMLIALMACGLVFASVSAPVEARSTLPPSFDKHFAQPLLKGETANDANTEKVFNFSCVDKNKTIKENVECLFFPAGSGGAVWDILRYVGYLLVFVAIVLAATKLLF